jgi:hypothetical protein
MGKETCRNCKYFNQYLAEDGDHDAIGDCHRYPPVLQPGFDCLNDRDSDVFDFPTTEGKFWCGEFVSKRGGNK